MFRPMQEAEWKTRQLRIDSKLRSLNPSWEIIPWQAKQVFGELNLLFAKLNEAVAA